jgi:DNA-binding beta-propeller fold protein YncE
VLSILIATAALVPARHALQAQSTRAAGTSTDTLWITMGDSDEIVEADAYTFKELRRIKTDAKPHGMAASPDGSKIYLVSDRTGNLQVVDVRRGAVVGQLALGKDPNQLALTQDGRFAYVPLRGEDQIAVVQLDPLTLVKMLPSPKGPHDAYRSADGSRIFIGAQYGNAIVAIDTATQSIAYTIPTADGVRPLEPSRDGRTIYAALSNLMGFVVADTTTRKVVRRVELGTLPDGLPRPYLDTFTHSLQLTPDGTELWVTDCINDLVRVVRLSDMREVAQIRVGHFPHWFTMRSDGKVMFLSLWYSDAVSAIDIASHRVLANIQFARLSGPKRILIAPKVAGR